MDITEEDIEKIGECLAKWYLSQILIFEIRSLNLEQDGDKITKL